MTLKVIGYGDNVIDNYPKQSIYFPGGNALNFSVNAKMIGADAYYIGEIGNDIEGRYIKSILDYKQINREYCFTSENSKTEKAQVEIIKGERFFLPTIRGSRRAVQISEHVLKNVFNKADLVFSGCHSGVEEEIQKWRNIPALRSFDFSDVSKYRTERYLKKICRNIDIALFSSENDDLTELNRLKFLSRKYGVKYTMFTRGGGKVPLLYSAKLDCEYHGVVSESKEVVDTMGAGDAYFTSFLLSLLNKGWDRDDQINIKIMEESFNFAAEYAKKIVQIEGSFGCKKAY